MVLIMLVSYTCVCPGDLISVNNAAITRPPITVKFIKIYYKRYSNYYRNPLYM